MVELTTLSVSKKGGSSFVPKIKPKIPAKNRPRDDGCARINAEDGAREDPAPRVPDSGEPAPHPEAEVFDGTAGKTSASKLAKDVDASLDLKSQETDPQLHAPDTPPAIPTYPFKPFLDSIPGIQTTKTTFHGLPTTPALSALTPKTADRSDSHQKPHNRKIGATLDSSTIQSMPLEVLIRHKFKHGTLSKSEKRRMEASVGTKSTTKRSYEDESSGTSSSCAMSPSGVATLEKRAAVPRLVMVDGRIMLDHSSLLVRKQEADANLEEIDEGAQRLITSSSFLASRHAKKVKWTKELTDKFYEGLSYFGTNFGLISILLQNVDRRQIKSKFNIEEKTNGWKLTAALKNRKPIKEVAEILRRNVVLKNSCREEDSSGM